MAILRSQDGKFYDVDDSLLTGKEVPGDKVNSGPSYPPPSAGGGGFGLAGGLVQIIVTAPSSGAGPDLGPPPGTEDSSKGGDVQGHSGDHGHGGGGGGWGWHNCWHNCWHNWHNCWHNYHCPW